MKIHKREVLLSLLSLSLGLFIYIFFRKETYIHTLLRMNHSFGFSHLNFFGSDFIKYYLPDFLWAFSLTNALIAVSEKTKVEVYIIGVVVIFLSIVWEILQLVKIVGGTFDFMDCFLYLIAAIAAVVIGTERKKK